MLRLLRNPPSLEFIPKLEVLVKAESDLAALLTWRRWNDGPIISFVFKQPHREASAGHWGEAKGGEKMATISISEKNVWFHPATKREADLLAVKLFCLFAFILVGLITAGVL